MLARHLGVALQLRHVGLGARDLDVPGRLELHVLAEQLIEIVPQRPRPARERQLGRMPPLLANAAEIDAACAGAAQALFQHRDRESGLAQGDSSRARRGAAANDRDVDCQALGHGSPPIGSGFTGGLPRRRPTAAMSFATVRARISAAA